MPREGESGLLRDAHGRRISDLRVSVTDRCNFRCQYCMPAEGLPWLERDEILSFEEIERLVGLFIQTRKEFRAKRGLFHILYLSEPVGLVDDVVQRTPLVEALAIVQE